MPLSGHRHHDVGVGRVPPARAGGPACSARLEDVAAEDPAVGAGEVDVLEDALARRAPAGTDGTSGCRRGRPRSARRAPRRARTSASMRSRAQVSEATTSRPSSLPDHQRPEAPRIARGHQRVPGQEQEREGAHHLARGWRRWRPPAARGGCARRDGGSPRCRRWTGRSSPPPPAPAAGCRRSPGCRCGRGRWGRDGSR